MSTRRGRFKHEPVPGHAVELLAGGEQFYPRILEDIAAAREEVLLCTYLWVSDEVGRRFLQAARDAARRGVRVAVLLDGIGSLDLDREDIYAVRRSGGAVATYHALRLPLFDSRLFRRNHRKLLLVDGRVAYVGGAGFATSWWQSPPAQWWDLMARVRGPVLATLREIFAEDWQRAAHAPLPGPVPGVPPPAGDETLQALVTRRSRPELLRRLRLAVRNAHEHVDIASAYFVPGFGLRRALIGAARRGVAMRLLVPGPRTDHFAVWSAGRRHYHRLLLEGIRIHEFQRSMLHSKYAVVDGRWGYLGSSNLDAWSRRFNLELDLAVLSPATLSALSQRFEHDLQHSREISLQQWEARPLSLRLAETVFGWIDPLL